MAKNNDTLILRVPEEVKKELIEVFGVDLKISEMVRTTIETYLNDIRKAKKGIVKIYFPIDLFTGSDLESLYKKVDEMEEQVTRQIIISNSEKDIEYLKTIQNFKSLIVSHKAIEEIKKRNKYDLEKLEK